MTIITAPLTVLDDAYTGLVAAAMCDAPPAGLRVAARVLAILLSDGDPLRYDRATELVLESIQDDLDVEPGEGRETRRAVDLLREGVAQVRFECPWPVAEADEDGPYMTSCEAPAALNADGLGWRCAQGHADGHYTYLHEDPVQTFNERMAERQHAAAR
jgi:hypothetical protein